MNEFMRTSVVGGAAVSTVDELSAANRASMIPTSGEAATEYQTSVQGASSSNGFFMGPRGQATAPTDEAMAVLVRNRATVKAVSNTYYDETSHDVSSQQLYANALLNAGIIKYDIGEAVYFVNSKMYDAGYAINSADYTAAETGPAIQARYAKLLSGDRNTVNAIHRRVANMVHALKTAILAQTNDTNPFYAMTEAEIYDRIIEHSVVIGRSLAAMTNVRIALGIRDCLNVGGRAYYDNVYRDTYTADTVRKLQSMLATTAANISGKFILAEYVAEYAKRCVISLAPSQVGCYRIFVPTIRNSTLSTDWLLTSQLFPIAKNVQLANNLDSVFKTMNANLMSQEMAVINSAMAPFSQFKQLGTPEISDLLPTVDDSLIADFFTGCNSIAAYNTGAGSIPNTVSAVEVLPVKGTTVADGNLTGTCAYTFEGAKCTSQNKYTYPLVIHSAGFCGGLYGQSTGRSTDTVKPLFEDKAYTPFRGVVNVVSPEQGAVMAEAVVGRSPKLKHYNSKGDVMGTYGTERPNVKSCGYISVNVDKSWISLVGSFTHPAGVAAGIKSGGQIENLLDSAALGGEDSHCSLFAISKDSTLDLNPPTSSVASGYWNPFLSCDGVINVVNIGKPAIAIVTHKVGASGNGAPQMLTDLFIGANARDNNDTAVQLDYLTRMGLILGIVGAPIMFGSILKKGTTVTDLNPTVTVSSTGRSEVTTGDTVNGYTSVVSQFVSGFVGVGAFSLPVEVNYGEAQYSRFTL